MKPLSNEEIERRLKIEAHFWGGGRVELNVGGYWKAKLEETFHWHLFSYRIASVAKGNNPYGLTDEQVGEGLRLLEPREIHGRESELRFERWDNANQVWVGGCSGDFEGFAYRTKLSEKQVKLVDECSGWIPWFGGALPVTMDTKVDFKCYSGGGTGSESAYRLRWTKEGLGNDIIAYRVMKKAWTPQEGMLLRMPQGTVLFVNSSHPERNEIKASMNGHRLYKSLSEITEKCFYAWPAEVLKWTPCV